MALSQGVSIFFVFVASLFCIIALATPAWLTYSSGGAKSESGIFMVKFTPASGSAASAHFEGCKMKGDAPFDGLEVTGKQCDNLKAAQAFGIIAVLCYLVALLLSIFICACKKTGFGYLVALLTIAGGITGLICMGIVADKLKKDAEESVTFTYDYGYSFALMTVAWIVALIDGVIMFVASYQAGKTA